MYFILLLLIVPAIYSIIIIKNYLKKPKTITVNPGLKEKYTHMSHRGNSSEIPENTILAFSMAVAKYDTDVLEMDVHSTKDGEIVVIHDKTLDRTTDGKGRIREHTYDEIKKLDAGYRFKSKDKEGYPFRGKGIKVPRLKDVFETFPDLKFNIEVKQKNPPIENKVTDLIREKDLTNKVIIGSALVSVSKKLKEAAPDIASFCHKWDVILFYVLHKLHMGFLYRPEHQAIQPTANAKFFKITCPSMIQSAHKKGMLFHAWVVNDEKQMEELLKTGVDGIMTDYPERLDKVLKKLNKR